MPFQRSASFAPIPVGTAEPHHITIDTTHGTAVGWLKRGHCIGKHGIHGVSEIGRLDELL